jgi:cell division protein FtsI (penicillin-binding protein 3)
MGVELVERPALALAPLGLIGCFLAGVISGAIIGRRVKGRHKRVLLGLVAAPLGTGAALLTAGHPIPFLALSATAMGLANNVFARDGEVIPITMLRQEQPVSGIRVISPETAREIRTMLQMAAGPGGTGQLAQTIGYSVGGKSGTAHKQEGKGYASNKYRSWFVGLAPIDKPRIVVAVMVDEPSNGKYYGGAVAAPVFSQVVQQSLRVLGVPPDLDVKPRVVAKGVPDAPESF